MGPARIYPWRKMYRSRAPSIAPGTFFVAQPWADCITNIPGFNLRQAQVDRLSAELAKINTDPTFQDKLQLFGIISTPLRNDDYVKSIQGEISRYGKIALETHISIN